MNELKSFEKPIEFRKPLLKERFKLNSQNFLRRRDEGGGGERRGKGGGGSILGLYSGRNIGDFFHE